MEILAKFAFVPEGVVELLDLIMAHLTVIALRTGFIFFDVRALILRILVSIDGPSPVVFAVVIDAVLEFVGLVVLAGLRLEGQQVQHEHVARDCRAMVPSLFLLSYRFGCGVRFLEHFFKRGRPKLDLRANRWVLDI